MSLNRFAKRKDANQTPIVEALRAEGALVHIQDFPDLAVKYQGQLHWLEVGNPENKYRKRTKKQLDFIAKWGIPIVESVFEAKLHIGIKLSIAGEA